MNQQKSRVVQDRIYGSVTLHGPAVDIIDTTRFQGLREIRQLGWAYLVHPAAVHTRFEHPIGAYHLLQQVVRRMKTRGELTSVSEEEILLALLAMLTHDVGHHHGAHVLEEYGLKGVDHEKAGERWIIEGEIGEILHTLGIEGAAEEIARIIRHESDNPLSGLVAGAVDCDRKDYMQRDAVCCNLGIGFNQGRLVDSLTLVDHPETGKPTVAVLAKGVESLDQMQFLRYQLYRICYWHPVVRSASAMGRSVILQSLALGLTTVSEVQTWVDAEMFYVLKDRLKDRRGAEYMRLKALLERLRHRRLHKVAMKAPMRSLPRVHPTQAMEIERYFARKFGMSEGDVLLDVPHKPGMYEPDVHVVRKDGSLVHRSELTPDDGYTANVSAEAMYQGSGKICLFVADSSIKIDPDEFLLEARAILDDVGESCVI